MSQLSGITEKSRSDLKNVKRSDLTDAEKCASLLETAAMEIRSATRKEVPESLKASVRRVFNEAKAFSGKTVVKEENNGNQLNGYNFEIGM